VDNGEGDPDNPLSVKHLFRNSTWLQNSITYNPEPKQVVGVSGHRHAPNNKVLFKMMLFRLFWPDSLLRKLL
jgi:hypothetical protein